MLRLRIDIRLNAKCSSQITRLFDTTNISRLTSGFSNYLHTRKLDILIWGFVTQVMLRRTEWAANLAFAMSSVPAMQVYMCDELRG